MSARQPARLRARPTMETAINQGPTYTCPGMPTAGPLASRHGVILSRRGTLSPSRRPHVHPRCSQSAPAAATCTSITHARAADEIDAMPSHREAQPDHDADYQTAYQSARTIALNGGLGLPIASLRAGPSHRPTIDGMEEVRVRVLKLHLRSRCRFVLTTFQDHVLSRFRHSLRTRE
jgi:hypothetical protein